MTSPLLGWPLLLLVALHARYRYPGWSGLILVAPGRRFALPLSGHFGLTLGAATRAGAGFAELVLLTAAGQSGPRLLIVRDQVDRAGWRRLRLLLRESA